MSQMACHTMFLALTLSPEMTMQAMYLLTWTGLGLIQPMPSCSCLGGLHDEDLVNEGPHDNLHAVQVGHEQPQLSDLLPIMVKGELGDVHEQPQLPVLKFM